MTQLSNRPGDRGRYANLNALVGVTHLPRMVKGLIGAILTIALLMVVLIAGCINEDSGMVNSCDVTLPTVTSTDPATGATDVALDKIITATFRRTRTTSGAEDRTRVAL